MVLTLLGQVDKLLFLYSLSQGGPKEILGTESNRSTTFILYIQIFPKESNWKDKPIQLTN
jgi:hypothetical protein